MSKGLKKEKRSLQAEKPIKARAGLLCLAVLALLLLAAAGSHFMKSNKGKNGKAGLLDSGQGISGITLPYNSEADGDGLEISAFYQFTGPNPDCKNEDGSDIAALTIRNCRQQLLRSVKIQVNLENGQEYHFYAEYLPAGKTAQIFETTNAAYEVEDKEDPGISIQEIRIDDQYVKSADRMEDQVECQVKDNETLVTLSNRSDKELKNLKMRCHTLFDGDYFGGITYRYEVGAIPAGGSLSYDAVDCYLGTAEVVELTSQ